MSPADASGIADGLDTVTRRDAMKTGVTLASVLSLGAITSGLTVADFQEVIGSPGSFDMFLKIDGIDGDSTDHRHEGAIDVLAWSWGGANSASMHLARGGGAGKATFQDLSVFKHVDSATPALWLATATGKHFNDARLTIQKPGGDTHVDMLVIDLEDLIVTSIEDAGTTTRIQLESITLNFARFKITYTPQAPDGTPLTPITAGYDIQKHEAY